MPSPSRLGVAKIIVWLVACSVIAEEGINWVQLKDELGGAESGAACEKIAANWLSRPDDFFAGTSEESWERIVPLLSNVKIASVQARELESTAACRAFVKHLPVFPRAAEFSESFRHEVYHQLVGPNSKEISRIVPFIPIAWVEQDGFKVTDALVWSDPPQLGLLSNPTLKSLLQNVQGACRSITLPALASLSARQLKMLTPSCMAAISGLEKMDLSPMVRLMRSDVFAEYNGGLTQLTIEGLSSTQLFKFGSLISEDTLICTLLELAHLRAPVSGWVSSRCLHGYLSQQPRSPLGDFWKTIPLGILVQFTPDMRYAWENIATVDLVEMESAARKIILATSVVCSSAALSGLTVAVMEDLSAPCLEALLSQPGGPFKLGELWMRVSAVTIASFTEEMMVALGNVHISDISNMPAWVLQVFFQSETILDNFSGWSEPVELSPSAEFVVLSSRQFAKLAKVAPNVAGQLLLVAVNLPDNVLADCDGPTIRSLTLIVPGKTTLGWEGLFAAFEMKSARFNRMIQLMSSGTGSSSAIFKDFRDYLWIPWLARRFGVWAVLGPLLDGNDPKLPLLSRISTKTLPLLTMLEKLDSSGWALVFQDENLTETLKGYCEFWAVFNYWNEDVLRTIAKKVLGTISPHCIPKMDDILRKDAWLIPLLPADAFSAHQLGQLPCALKDLSAVQISQLSKYTIVDWDKPTAKEIAQHAVANVTLEELKALNHDQTSALLGPQFIFIPGDVRSVALNWQFSRVMAVLRGASRYGPLVSLAASAEKINGALRFLLTTQSGGLEINSAELVKFLPIIRQSDLYDCFVPLFEKNDLLKACVPGLFPNAKDFYNYLQKTIKRHERKVWQLKVPFNHDSGFDRPALISLLESNPKAFASPDAHVVIPGIKERSKLPMRLLISQLLSDIRRDLILESGVNKNSGHGQSEAPHSASIETNMRGTAAPDGKAHFIWGIGKEAGLIVGLALAKALQLKLRLPFVLDTEFYTLMIDPTEESMESYYEKTYQAEREQMKNRILSHPELVVLSKRLVKSSLPHLDHIRFAKLSLEASPKRVKVDRRTKTNVSNCDPNKGLYLCSDKESLRALERYFQGHHGIVVGEFKSFVRELARGWTLGWPVLGKLAKMSRTAFQPLEAHLPALLNAELIKGDQLIGRVEFSDNQEVYSLKKGRVTYAATVVSAFIQSLDSRLLQHLVHVWTGVSTLSVQYTKLFVKFTAVSAEPPMRIDYCQSDPQGGTTGQLPTISPGKEYQKIFASIFQRLLGLDNPVGPECSPGGVEFIPIKPLIEDKSLLIVLQPAQQVINSLVHLLNTPIATIMDAFGG